MIISSGSMTLGLTNTMRAVATRVSLLAFLVLGFACASHTRSEDVRAIRIEGYILEVDEINQLIVLQRRDGERRTDMSIRFNTLTLVDYLDRSGKVYDLQFGDHILVYGLETIEDGDALAERIVVLEGRRPRIPDDPSVPHSQASFSRAYG